MPECNFHIGQHVICVEEPLHFFLPPPPMPVLKQIYTIKGFCNKKHSDHQIGVYIEEMERKPDGMWCDCFWHGLFKPVKETNIEQFRQIVKPIFEKHKDVEIIEALTP